MRLASAALEQKPHHKRRVVMLTHGDGAELEQLASKFFSRHSKRVTSCAALKSAPPVGPLQSVSV